MFKGNSNLRRIWVLYVCVCVCRHFRVWQEHTLVDDCHECVRCTMVALEIFSASDTNVNDERTNLEQINSQIHCSHRMSLNEPMQCESVRHGRAHKFTPFCVLHCWPMRICVVCMWALSCSIDDDDDDCRHRSPTHLHSYGARWKLKNNNRRNTARTKLLFN